ncbi:MAG: hypothetical protein QOF78_3138 [Phycisphaerales bacterium]|jgi:hypothetical protein|nr:hypothetical protein [Phycisphaerales bacterium]
MINRLLVCAAMLAAMLTIISGAFAQNADSDAAAVRQTFAGMLRDKGLDPASAEVVAVQGQLERLATSLTTQAEAIDTLKRNAQSMRRSMQTDQAEFDRLDAQGRVDAEDLNARALKLKAAWNAMRAKYPPNNADGKHYFNLPDEKAEYAAAQEEERPLIAAARRIETDVEALKTKAASAEALQLRIAENKKELAKLIRGITTDEAALAEVRTTGMQAIATALNELQEKRTPVVKPSNRALDDLHKADARSNDAAKQSAEPAKASARSAFDGGGPSGRSLPENYDPPPEVTGSSVYQRAQSDADSLSEQIAAQKRVLFDPNATPEQRQTAQKQRIALQSLEVWKKYELGTVQTPTSLPPASVEQKTVRAGHRRPLFTEPPPPGN